MPLGDGRPRCRACCSRSRCGRYAAQPAANAVAAALIAAALLKLLPPQDSAALVFGQRRASLALVMVLTPLLLAAAGHSLAGAARWIGGTPPPEQVSARTLCHEVSSYAALAALPAGRDARLHRQRRFHSGADTAFGAGRALPSQQRGQSCRRRSVPCFTRRCKGQHSSAAASTMWCSVPARRSSSSIERSAEGLAVAACARQAPAWSATDRASAKVRSGPGA